jgi:hypothetical protein
MFKKLAMQLKQNRSEYMDSRVTSPISSIEKETKNSFLNGLSKHALNLYEKKSDIKKFTKLAISDWDNQSQNDIISKIFPNGSPIDDESLFEVSENERFLDDIYGK